MSNPLNIFIGYACADEALKERLLSHLAVLRRGRLVDAWYCCKVDSGDGGCNEIGEIVEGCKLALLLVSDAFLHSAFIGSAELDRLMERHERAGIRVVTIVLRPCGWQRVKRIASLQCLPRSGEALAGFAGDDAARDRAWSEITQSLAELAKVVQEGAAAPAAAAPDSAELLGRLAFALGAAFFRHASTPAAGLPAPVADVALSGTHPVNPFNPWEAAAPPRFVGRDDLLQRLDIALEERRSVSLVGGRRIGKSSLLQTWQRVAEGRGHMVRMVDGLGPEALSCAALVRAISGLDAPDEADGAADVLARWAANIVPAGVPPLILIDGADALLLRLPSRFFERLGGMLERICLVIATRREIDRLYRETGRASPFGEQLELHCIGLLEPDAAEMLIARGAVALGDDDMQTMRDWCGRHPYCLALLGRRLWDARCRGEDPGEALELFKDEAYARMHELCWAG